MRNHSFVCDERFIRLTADRSQLDKLARLRAALRLHIRILIVIVTASNNAFVAATLLTGAQQVQAHLTQLGTQAYKFVHIIGKEIGRKIRLIYLLDYFGSTVIKTNKQTIKT